MNARLVGLLAFAAVLGLSSAVSHVYYCYGGGYVSYSDYCDGHPDCPYGDDEDCTPAEYCPHNTHHRCSDTGVCISAYDTCDGYADCPNGEDESYYNCYAVRSATNKNSTVARPVERNLRNRK